MIKPWLWLPPQWTHYLAPFFLKLYSSLFSTSPYQWKPLSWRHLYFPNPLGTAGGVDKNAEHIHHWWTLGSGFCEVGTVTPQPQKANPSKILDRSLKYKSLWNAMGFPNKGLEFFKTQCEQLPSKKPTPLIINIGKNRNTKIEETLEDYKKCLKDLHPFADIFVINISSPNTKNLRDLFKEENLLSFLKKLKEFSSQINPKTPLLLKLSPDTEEKDFFRIIDQSLEANIDGWCLTNTTINRPIPHLFPSHGGISGQLLKEKSLSLLKSLTLYLKQKNIQDKLIISCGGVLTPQDVQERLKEGAHLVQVYSALVFTGPSFFKKVFQFMSKEQANV